MFCAEQNVTQGDSILINNSDSRYDKHCFLKLEYPSMHAYLAAYDSYAERYLIFLSDILSSPLLLSLGM
jgi:hypothetical protein